MKANFRASAAWLLRGQTEAVVKKTCVPYHLIKRSEQLAVNGNIKQNRAVNKIFFQSYCFSRMVNHHIYESSLGIGYSPKCSEILDCYVQ